MFLAAGRPRLIGARFASAPRATKLQNIVSSASVYSKYHGLLVLYLKYTPEYLLYFVYTRHTATAVRQQYVVVSGTTSTYTTYHILYEI